MKIIVAICLLLAGVIAAHAAFGIFMAGNNVCGGGGVLVTADGTCTNVLTTGGADPLTP